MISSKLRRLIFKHSLLNAIQHNGKSELGAVINKMIAEDSTLKSDIKQLISEIKPILNQINSMSQNEQIKNFQKDFPNTKTSTKKDEKFSLPQAIFETDSFI